MRTVFASLLIALAVMGVAPSLDAQACPAATTQGCFEPPYNHLNNHGSYRFPDAVWTSPQGLNQRFNALHVALIPTPGPLQGKVLAWDYGEPNCDRSSPGIQRWSILDPSKLPTDPDAFWNFTLPIAPTNGRSNDIACAGFTWLENGRLLVAGGTEAYAGTTLGCPAHSGPIIGAKLVFTFEPARWNPNDPNAMWVRRSPDLQHKRYYPTLAYGKRPWVFIARGHTDDTTYDPEHVIVPDDFEVWDRFAAGDGAVRTDLPYLLGPNPFQFVPLLIYPRMHLLSTGEMFQVGMDRQCASIREPIDPWVHKGWFAPLCRWYGTSVLFPNIDAKHTDATMILGGQSTDFAQYVAVLKSVQLCKGSAATAGSFNAVPQGWDWTPVDGSPGTLPSMNDARIYPNAVLLPDASVLVIGGTRTPEGVFPADYVYTAERFKGGQWESLAVMQVNRRYHATTLLLPSGQVLVAGGEGRALDYEVYNPPYMYKPRPTVTAAPQEVGYGGTYQVHFTLPTGSAFGKIVLMRPGCNTHHFDGDQRYHQPPLLPVLEGEDPSQSPRTFALPLASDPDRQNKLPPGYYMLHVLTGDGTPSVAHWLEVLES
jgi:hypothetical protein